MKKKIQILVIHGGMTFKNKKDYINFLKKRKISLEKKTYWTNDYLEKKLGKNFKVIRPRMPLQDNAKYNEWEIHFRKYISKLEGPIILIGSSLGGIFLAKYLSENKIQKKIISTYLICPPFDDTISKEDLAGGFHLKSDLSNIQKNTKSLILMFSKTDEVIPLSHARKYKEKIPIAKLIIYENKNGHFKISKFPEIIKMIKRDAKDYFKR